MPCPLCRLAKACLRIVEAKDVEVGECARKDADGRVHRHHSVCLIEKSCSTQNWSKAGEAKDRHGRAFEWRTHGAPFDHIAQQGTQRVAVTIVKGEDAVCCLNRGDCCRGEGGEV